MSDHLLPLCRAIGPGVFGAGKGGLPSWKRAADSGEVAWTRTWMGQDTWDLALALPGFCMQLQADNCPTLSLGASFQQDW